MTWAKFTSDHKPVRKSYHVTYALLWRGQVFEALWGFCPPENRLKAISIVSVGDGWMSTTW